MSKPTFAVNSALPNEGLHTRFHLALVEQSLNEIQTRDEKFFGGLEFFFQTMITQSKLS